MKNDYLETNYCGTLLCYIAILLSITFREMSSCSFRNTVQPNGDTVVFTK